jgi:hypothetical protein
MRFPKDDGQPADARVPRMKVPFLAGCDTKTASPGTGLPARPPRTGLFRRYFRRTRGPICCVTESDKAWIEQSLLWFKSQFGLEPLRQPVLIPGSPVLPSQWRGSCEEGAELVHRLCGYMQVDPARIALAYYSAEEQPALAHVPLHEWSHEGPAGLFFDSRNKDHFVLGLEVAGLGRPDALVATVCHELSHVRLLGEGRLTGKEADLEARTDLLSVFFGAGIFTANCAIQFQQWQAGNCGGWRAGRLGYLSEPVLGYSLAAYAWMRGETAPPWARWLRFNISPYFEEDLYFLTRTGNTILPSIG